MIYGSAYQYENILERGATVKLLNFGKLTLTASEALRAACEALPNPDGLERGWGRCVIPTEFVSEIVSYLTTNRDKLSSEARRGANRLCKDLTEYRDAMVRSQRESYEDAVRTVIQNIRLLSTYTPKTLSDVEKLRRELTASPNNSGNLELTYYYPGDKFAARYDINAYFANPATREMADYTGKIWYRVQWSDVSHETLEAALEECNLLMVKQSEETANYYLEQLPDWVELAKKFGIDYKTEQD